MRHGLIALVVVLAACASPGNAPTSIPPSPTRTAPPMTLPQPTATIEPAASTPAVESRPVTFKTDDGVTLNGTLYGHGTTAVILSAMGAQKQDTWEGFAKAIAAQGYVALTYNFRYWVTDTRIDGSLRVKAPDDLRAAMTFARTRGAQHIVLVGASLGAMATAKVAAGENPSAVVIIAAPFMQSPLPGLVIEKSDIEAIAAPKLFVETEHDEAGFTADVQRMYDAAAEPKDIQLYPGSAHGTDIFATQSGDELTRRLIQFITAQAPVDQPTAN
jgi:dienelactone hydrolase